MRELERAVVVKRDNQVAIVVGQLAACGKWPRRQVGCPVPSSIASILRIRGTRCLKNERWNHGRRAAKPVTKHIASG